MVAMVSGKENPREYRKDRLYILHLKEWLVICLPTFAMLCTVTERTSFTVTQTQLKLLHHAAVQHPPSLKLPSAET
jgi:hypothetical protein